MISVSPVDGLWIRVSQIRRAGAGAARAACDRHVYVPALVKGEQTDVTETGIVYDWGEQGPDGVPSNDYFAGKAAEVAAVQLSIPGAKVV